MWINQEILLNQLQWNSQLFYDFKLTYYNLLPKNFRQFFFDILMILNDQGLLQGQKRFRLPMGYTEYSDSYITLPGLFIIKTGKYFIKNCTQAHKILRFRTLFINKIICIKFYMLLLYSIL
ncbi:MAG: hypothetical protein FD155_604 [Bacteroidetes bacterium]|nr:MAG: hypothetical protein FD155_604 [Bacteroidota bacterium]